MMCLGCNYDLIVSNDLWQFYLIDGVRVERDAHVIIFSDLTHGSHSLPLIFGFVKQRRDWVVIIWNINGVPGSQEHNVTHQDLVLEGGSEASSGAFGFFQSLLHLSSNTTHGSDRSTWDVALSKTTLSRYHGSYLPSNLATSSWLENMSFMKAVFLNILNGVPVSLSFLTMLNF